MKRILYLSCLLSVASETMASIDLQGSFRSAMYVQSHPDIQKIKSFFDQDPKIDVNQCLDEVYKSTPLMEAARIGDIELLKLLLQYGADIHAQDHWGLSALFYARNHDAITYLLDCGANINDMDFHSQTLLFEVVHSDDVDLIQFVLDKGANINHQNKYGETALMTIASFPFASDYRNENDAKTIATINLLLENNADVNLRDRHGHTVLQNVEVEGFMVTAQLLKDFGAIK